MSYEIKPLPGQVLLVELKAAQVQEITNRQTVNLDQNSHDVLQYGRVLDAGNDVDNVTPGDLVLYAKLASDKTNFGKPGEYQILIEAEHIKAKLIKKEAGDVN